MIISSNAAALYLMYSVNINQLDNWCPFALKLLYIVNRELRELIQNDVVHFRGTGFESKDFTLTCNPGRSHKIIIQNRKLKLGHFTMRKNKIDHVNYLGLKSKRVLDWLYIVIIWNKSRYISCVQPANDSRMKGNDFINCWKTKYSRSIIVTITHIRHLFGKCKNKSR